MLDPFETSSALRGRLFDCVFELVGMRASGGLKGHPASKSGQLAAAGKVVCRVEEVPLEDVNAVLERMRRGDIRGRMVLRCC